MYIMAYVLTFIEFTLNLNDNVGPDVEYYVIVCNVISVIYVRLNNIQFYPIRPANQLSK